jgi:hypothetical protein
MFKSELTGKIYGKGTHPVKVVTERRAKTYEHFNFYGESLGTTQGWEIVKEISVGPDEVHLIGELDSATADESPTRYIARPAGA